MSTRKRRRQGFALTREELVTVGFGAAVLLIVYWGVRGMDPSGAVAGLAGALLALLRLLYGKATEDDNGNGNGDVDQAAAGSQLAGDPNQDHTGLDNRRVAAHRGGVLWWATRRKACVVG